MARKKASEALGPLALTPQGAAAGAALDLGQTAAEAVSTPIVKARKDGRGKWEITEVNITPAGIVAAGLVAWGLGGMPGIPGGTKAVGSQPGDVTVAKGVSVPWWALVSPAAYLAWKASQGGK